MALKCRSSNSVWQRSTIASTGERRSSAVLPLRLALRKECDEALVGVAGFHQPVEIQLLGLGQAVAHVAKHRAARGSQGMGQAGRALARQVSVEVRQRGSFRVVGYVLHQPGGTRLVGAD